MMRGRWKGEPRRVREEERGERRSLTDFLSLAFHFIAVFSSFFFYFLT